MSNTLCVVSFWCCIFNPCCHLYLWAHFNCTLCSHFVWFLKKKNSAVLHRICFLLLFLCSGFFLFFKEIISVFNCKLRDNCMFKLYGQKKKKTVRGPGLERLTFFYSNLCELFIIQAVSTYSM